VQLAEVMKLLLHLILIFSTLAGVLVPATHAFEKGGDEGEDLPEFNNSLLPRKILELAILTSELTVQMRSTTNREPCEGCTAFQVYENKLEASWALVTRTPQNDSCLVIFSESATPFDWADNFNPGWSPYCENDYYNNSTGDIKKTCCNVRQGFIRAYSIVRKFVDNALGNCCAANSDPEEECRVFLTGASKGSAVAQVAAMYLRHLNPYIIALAPVQTIAPASCPFVSSDRMFGFINTYTNGTDLYLGIADKYIGLVYDIVPFLLPIVGAVPFGKNFLLSDDVTGVAFLGQDSLPLVMSKGPFAPDVHYLRSRSRKDSGYEPHIREILDHHDALLDGDGFVRTTGFATGSTCNYPFECESKNCDGKTRKCILLVDDDP
jgi:Lipase (class 3)